MALVKKSVEGAAAPSNLCLEPRIDGGEDVTQRPDRQVGEVAPLDSRDCRLSDA